MGAFWDDLGEDLADPFLRRTYAVESVRQATVSRIVAQLEEARRAAGLSKAALARAVDTNPDALRRLLTAGNVNPTLSTVAEIAAVLGLQLTLTPLAEEDRALLTPPIEDSGSDTRRREL
ncbi:helix-turn-helix domain-containing protein [Symbioplanes lichenis]|uniref:helix-turn-helix domain-containing protein n=1 Tax=Symbioplanes lichenis TaxID=1629072 RepID=UPI00273A5287|nr:helix-turn-helix transcriptional regulator [Actinoplanes lichenis]